MSSQRTKKSMTAEEKAARRRDKRPASSSSTDAPDIVWPRPPNTPFALPASFSSNPKKISDSDACYRRPYTSTWDDYDSFYYNMALNLTLQPTRLLDPQFMRQLKWSEYVEELCRNLGLGNMPFTHHDLYRELALQFFASCRIRYLNPHQPQACDGSLFFKIDGAPYSLSFHDICEVFGFDTSATELEIPDLDNAYQALWPELTNSFSYTAGKALQTEIRHPVLRVFLKLLDHTILCKMEPGKMRKYDMALLHFTIGRHFDYADESSLEHRLNFGAIFADLLESVKYRGLDGKQKIETLGSLVTPLLRRAGIDLSGREKDSQPNYIGEQSLKNGPFLSGRRGAYRYIFTTPDGAKRSIGIPSDFCRVDSADALRFLPMLGDTETAREHLDRRHRGSVSDAVAASSSSAPPPPAPFGPFVMPPAGTYEDDPYRSWLTQTLGGIWERLRTIPSCSCTRNDAVPPPPPPPPGARPRRARRGSDEDSDGRLSRSRSHTPPGL